MNCNVNMLNYFGGSPLTIVCDNCKTAVISHPRCGDIELNRRKEMAIHIHLRILSVESSSAKTAVHITERRNGILVLFTKRKSFNAISSLSINARRQI